MVTCVYMYTAYTISTVHCCVYSPIKWSGGCAEIWASVVPAHRQPTYRQPSPELNVQCIRGVPGNPEPDATEMHSFADAGLAVTTEPVTIAASTQIIAHPPRLREHSPRPRRKVRAGRWKAPYLRVPRMRFFLDCGPPGTLKTHAISKSSGLYRWLDHRRAKGGEHRHGNRLWGLANLA